MPEIDYELIKTINSGKCFAIIGSGLSTDSGLPSWKKLASDVCNKYKQNMPGPQQKKIEQRIQTNQFPKVFEDCEKQASSKEKYLIEVKEIFDSYPYKNSSLYSYISRWPIQTYLTTNYDDILYEELGKNGYTFIKKSNTKEDFATLSATSENIIFKIHGDFSDYENLVLTQNQYNEFLISPNREYWREKIFSTINMVPLLIIGYSIKDPDFAEQLERAKRIINPSRPVYMFAADMPEHEIIQYRQVYNIKIYSYKTNNGDHHELKKLLQTYNSFIRKRSSIIQELSSAENYSESETAASLYLYYSLRLDRDMENSYLRSMQYIVINLLNVAKKLTNDELIGQLKDKLHSSSNIDLSAYEKVKSKLFSLGFIKFEGNEIEITSNGNSMLSTINGERENLEEKFNRWCELIVKSNYPSLNEMKKIIKGIHDGLAEAFQKRGIEIAQAVTLEKSMDISEAPDIVAILNKQQKYLLNDSERNAFICVMLEIFSTNEKAVRDYIAALSQGYFAYHALGLDSSCNDVRVNKLKDRPWIVDSSVILPAIAMSCANNEYAIDLLKEMKANNIKLFTTHDLLKETIDHAYWVISYFKNGNISDLVFLQALMAGPGFKKNLFLDGYISWANRQGMQSFSNYLNECLGDNCCDELYNSVRKKIESMGIKVTDFQDWKGFIPAIWSSKDDWKAKIIKYRKDHDTFRNDEQCLAEAEIKALTSEYEIFFLSQSMVLDRINEKESKRITWTPESVFRLLSMFSKTGKKSDLYFQSIFYDYFYQGYNVINRDELIKLATPVINQAKIKLEEVLKEYESKLTVENIVKIRKDFDDIDDLSKPFYSYQMISILNRKETERANYYQRKAEVLEKENVNLKRNKPKKAKKKKRRNNRN